MNCTEFNNILINVGAIGLDGLSADQQAGFDAHQAGCPACQARLVAEAEATAALTMALRKLPVPAPSAGFADRVLRAAVIQATVQTATQAAAQQRPAAGADRVGRHQQRRSFMLGFGSAAAAALALWVVVGAFPEAVSPVQVVSEEAVAINTAAVIPASTASAKMAPRPELSITLNKQQDIKLAFYSGQSLEGARITIRLPENVALVGYPGRRELSWTTSLKKGDNLLRLPVIATQIAHGELVADIEYQDQVKTLTLGLEAKATDASRTGPGWVAVVG
ncbi:MAG: hypothetical protein RRB22_08225 [Gammaproteobacteria bacterium]|nr:hypothetical protein [Gammaproteobacteria bacterium]